TVVADESGSGPEDGSVSLALAPDVVTDLAGLTGPGDEATTGVLFAAESEAPVAVLHLTPTRTSIAPANTSFQIHIQFAEPVTGFGLEDIVLGGTSHEARPWSVDR